MADSFDNFNSVERAAITIVYRLNEDQVAQILILKNSLIERQIFTDQTTLQKLLRCDKFMDGLVNELQCSLPLAEDPKFGLSHFEILVNHTDGSLKTLCRAHSKIYLTLKNY